MELDYYLKGGPATGTRSFIKAVAGADCFEFYVVVDDDVVVTAPSMQLHAILADLPEDYLGAGADENYHHHAQIQIGGATRSTPDS